MQITKLNSLNEVQELIQWHNENSDYVVLDTETSGLSPFSDRLLLIVLSGYVPGESAVVFDPSFLPALRSLRTAVVAHNYRFDFNFLYRVGVDLRHLPVRDTMLLHHLLDENKSHKLDDIVKEYYDDDYKQRFWEQYSDYSLAPEAAQIQYAGKDVIYTQRVYRRLREELEECDITHSLIEHVHCLARSLLDTEIRGIDVDLDYLLEMGISLNVDIHGLREKMLNAAPTEISVIENRLYLRELEKRKTDKGKAGVKQPKFNFDSNTQIQQLLYEQCNLPVQMSKERKPTVDDAALESLEPLHPLVALLRDYRGKQKIYNAFITATLDKMHEGRIYPSFNVNGTVTGRISSSEPNMQQLPRSGGIRGIFLPAPGHVLLSCDYKQLEVTLAAHFSLDENLLKVVLEGESLHDITATALGIDRHLAKSINFALQYGAGAHKIAKILGVSLPEAEQALKRYWAAYPKLKAFIDRVHAELDKGQNIANPFGRVRRFVLTGDRRDAERAKRQAFNSLVQGTGADLTNRAFYLIDEELKTHKAGFGLFPVHDELLICVRKNTVAYWRERLQTVMIEVGKEINLRVPLAVDCSEGMERWLD